MKILMEAGTNRFENIERLMMVLVYLYGLCIILAKSLVKQLDHDPRSDYLLNIQRSVLVLACGLVV